METAAAISDPTAKRSPPPSQPLKDLRLPHVHGSRVPDELLRRVPRQCTAVRPRVRRRGGGGDGGDVDVVHPPCGREVRHSGPVVHGGGVRKTVGEAVLRLLLMQWLEPPFCIEEEIPHNNSCGWDKPLHPNAFNLATHLLNGLLHCNGFGHLLLINSHEGGSKFISGSVLMDLWDRLCTSLRVREVSAEDVSKKYSLDLRLLYGMSYGIPWFARWNYHFHSGSFGLTESSYSEAIDHLSFFPLDSLLANLNCDNIVELHHIVSTYRKLHPLKTIRDLLRFILDLKNQNIHPPPPPKNPQPPKKTKRAKTEDAKKKPRDFASVVAGLASRWLVRRLITVAQVVVDALFDHGSKMTRQQVRDAARLTIGDTGLIDLVLKSMGDTIIDGHIVHRKSNPVNRVLEFSLGKIQDTQETETGPDTECTILSCATRQVEKDLQIVYNCILAVKPHETRVVLDTKHWGTTFDPHNEADDYLRFYIQWMQSQREMEWLTHALPLPELVVLDAYASIGDLKAEAERAMRDTYCTMERFRVAEMEGIEGEDWAPMMLACFQFEATIRTWGELLEVEDPRLKYEGGEDTWVVRCARGTRQDDREGIVACDACDVWYHTRCIGIDDGDPVLQLFLCAKCGSRYLQLQRRKRRRR